MTSYEMMKRSNSKVGMCLLHVAVLYIQYNKSKVIMQIMHEMNILFDIQSLHYKMYNIL